MDGGCIQLQPPVADLEAGVLETYDDLITCTHGVDDISIKVLNMNSDVKLASVALDEDVAQEGRGIIRDVLARNAEAPQVRTCLMCMLGVHLYYMGAFERLQGKRWRLRVFYHTWHKSTHVACTRVSCVDKDARKHCTLWWRS